MKNKNIGLFLLLIWAVSSGYAQQFNRRQTDSAVALLPKLETNVNGVKISLKIAQFYIGKEGSLKPDLDSAAFFIKKSKFFAAPLNSRWANGYILMIEAQLADERGDKATGKLLISKSVNLLQKENDKVLLGEATYALSRYYSDYYDASQNAVRVRLVETAVHLLEASPDKKEYAADLQMLADLYSIEDKYSQSIEVLKKCLAVYQSIHHKNLQGVYVLFTKNYNALTDFQQALKYGLLAEKACYDTRDTSAQICEVENAVASTYYYLGENDLALAHFNKALMVAEKLGIVTSMIAVINNICSVQMRLHHPQQALNLLSQFSKKYIKKEDVYAYKRSTKMFLQLNIALGNYRAAKVYYERSKELLKNPSMKTYDVQAIYPTLIDYLLAIHNYKEARRYGQLFVVYAEKLHNNVERLNSYDVQYRIDSAMHNYQSAFFHAQRYKQISDSIFSEKKSIQIQNLEFVYKTKEKDDSISLLHQKTILQNTELNKSRRETSETIGGILLLIFCGGIFVRHYHIKRKVFRTIEDQNAIIGSKNEEIVFKNKTLEGLVQEKEYLLMEIHHRVKNNLHTVLSFLSLQARYLTGDALAAIKVSRQRIYAMSLIHQKLYLADDVKTIDIKSYLKEFISYFKECLSPDASIKFTLDIDPLRIPVSKAISIGLIINEAVTNSAKYAFPDNREGVISLSLKKKNEFTELIISDNGIGMREDLNSTEFNSLGIKLIKGLTNDLGGMVKFESAAGTRIQILFRDEN